MVRKILGRMENGREKSGEKIFLVDVWLEGGGKKKLVWLECFLPRPTKMFFSHNGEKTEWKMLMA